MMPMGSDPAALLDQFPVAGRFKLQEFIEVRKKIGEQLLEIPGTNLNELRTKTWRSIICDAVEPSVRFPLSA